MIVRQYRRNRIAGVFAAICIALSGLLYSELTRRPEEVIDAPTMSNPTPASSGQERQRDADALISPVESFSEVVERPLFWASRRPLALLPSGPMDAPAPVDFVLHGIVITTDERFAMFQQGAPSRLIRLSEGQELQGWTVQSILTDRVLLRNGDRVLELRFIDRPPVRERSGTGKNPPTASEPLPRPGQ